MMCLLLNCGSLCSSTGPFVGCLGVQSPVVFSHHPLILQSLSALEECQSLPSGPTVADKKSAVILTVFPKGKVFSLLLRFLSLLFSSFTMMCLGVDCFGFILFLVRSAS